MTAHADLRRWPLWLFTMHLLVPAGALAYAVLRLGRAQAPPSLPFALALAVAAGWLLAGLGVLIAPSGRRALRTHGRELMLALAVVTVVTVVTDAALTLGGVVPSMDALFAGNALRYRPSVHTMGRLAPSQSLQIPEGPRLDINSRGFRGPEIEMPKPARSYRLVFLGGSQVFDQYGSNWPLEVGARLATPEQPVDVVNAGVPAHRTIDSLGKYLTELWMLEPDGVVVCQAWNDIKYVSRVSPDTPYRDLYRPRPNDWRIEPNGLDRLLGTSAFYRLARVRVVALVAGREGVPRRALDGALTPWGIRQYRLALETLCDVAANTGARAVLCSQPRLPVAGSDAADRARIAYHWVGLEHDALVAAFALTDRTVADVAERKGATFVDLGGALSGRSELFADHIHFNVEGSREVARVVADALRKHGIPPPPGAAGAR